MSDSAELSILKGGINLAVRTCRGGTETVLVRLLKIKEFPDYLRLVDDEEPLAEFLCGKEPGWAETIDVASLLDICDQGHELNFRNACRWGERRAKVNEALLPIAVSGQAIQSVLPNSAPSARSSSVKA